MHILHIKIKTYTTRCTNSNIYHHSEVCDALMDSSHLRVSCAHHVVPANPFSLTQNKKIVEFEIIKQI